MTADSDLDFYDYFGVTMQEMIVRIEDHILLNIMNFITSLPLDQLTSASPTGKNPTSNVQAQKYKLTTPHHPHPSVISNYLI